MRQRDRPHPARLPDRARRPQPRADRRGGGRIRREQADCTVDSFLCDFADQAAVRRLADDLLATCERIDVLVNNAGTVFARRTLTADGIESTFAINHLGVCC